MYSLSYKQLITVVSLLFGVITLLWVAAYLPSTYQPVLSELFAFIYSLYPIFIGLMGLYFTIATLRKSRIFGVGLMFFSLAILFWGIGEITWFYLAKMIPSTITYPSLADVWYIMFYPFSIVGMIAVIRGLNKNDHLGKPLAFFSFGLIGVTLVTACLLLIPTNTFDLLVGEITSERISQFVDVNYLIWDTFLILLYMLVSGYTFVLNEGTVRKYTAFVLLGFSFFMLFLSDIVFTYSLSTGTYTENSFADLCYLITIYLLTLGSFGIAHEES